MKKILVALALALSLAPIKSRADFESEDQRQPRLQKHCNCYELERRMQGLQLVVTRVRVTQREQQVIRRDLNQARRYYNQVNFRRTSVNEQSRLCSLGNLAADQSWRRWQPWLARRGWDPGSRCGDSNLEL